MNFSKSMHLACASKCASCHQQGWPSMRTIKAQRECRKIKTDSTLCAIRRRDVFGILGALTLLSAPSAWSTEVYETAEASQTLPKNYTRFARKLLTALRDAIEADLSPASENEVRRKADPAKNLVKEWVRDWRDAPSLAKEPSYVEISDSIQLLGSFYREKGQRARLPENLGGDLLRHLDAASAALPANL